MVAASSLWSSTVVKALELNTFKLKCKDFSRWILECRTLMLASGFESLESLLFIVSMGSSWWIPEPWCFNLESLGAFQWLWVCRNSTLGSCSAFQDRDLPVMVSFRGGSFRLANSAFFLLWHLLPMLVADGVASWCCLTVGSFTVSCRIFDCGWSIPSPLAVNYLINASLASFLDAFASSDGRFLDRCRFWITCERMNDSNAFLLHFS